jgi:hypothetical protein
MLDTLATKQTVAESVLDRPGEVKEIKLRGGRQAFVERLQQLVTPASVSGNLKSQISNLKSALPADPALAFAQLAREKVNGALVRCEERYPQTGPHSVLVVVVDGNPAQYHERLAALHGELFGPGRTDPLAPTQLEVIDRATDEAIERLIAAGLISRTTRASRPLLPVEEAVSPPPLSDEEQARAKAHRELAARKLKMARLLGEGGLAEEARAALLEAVHPLGRALAIEARLPEPPTLDDALLPPLSHCWKEALPLLRSYAADAEKPWEPVLESLSKV